MVCIESTMEKIARVYSNNTGVKILIGDGFKTDAQSRIWIPPISDQADPWIRFETEVGVYHEIGHVLHTDHTNAPKNRTIFSVFNALEDTRIEKKMIENWPGIKNKQAKFLSEYTKKSINDRFSNPNVSVIKKILDLTYLKAKELQLKEDFNINLPKDVQDIYDKTIAPLIPEIINADTQDDIRDMTAKVIKAIKKLIEEEKQNQKENQKNPSQKGSSQKSNQKDSQDSDQDDSDQDDSDQDSQDGSGQGSDQDDSDQDSDGSGQGSDQDNSDQDSDGSSQGSDKGSDQDSNQGDSDQDGSGSDQDNDQEPTDDLLKQLEKEMEDETEASTLGDDIASDINKYADVHILYREDNDLKDQVIPRKEIYGWQDRVKIYENLGKKYTGYTGSKLRMLFISEHAPRWYRNQKSGKLDLKKIWNDQSNCVFKKRSSYTKEDAAVSLIIDNSGSMSGEKSIISSAILMALAVELDRLRIPFETSGFTSYENLDYTKNSIGIRTAPVVINMVKSFEEPFRRVRHRFVWPDYTNVTVELPCIKLAANRLAQRKETKKVLFILTDGETYGGGHTNLNIALRDATKEYIQKISRAGIHVVGFGIENDSMEYYCPDFISVNNLDVFAKEFFSKLMKFLTKGV